MAPATEIATFPVAAGATIEDSSSSAGKAWQSILDTVAAQDGYQRLYYGREVENPSVVQLLIGKLSSYNKCLPKPPATCPRSLLISRRAPQIGTPMIVIKTSSSPRYMARFLSIS